MRDFIKRLINVILFRIKNKSVKLGKNVFISYKTNTGHSCRIGNYCQILKDVRLGDNVVIGEYTKLRKITVGLNTMIESGVKVVGSGKGNIIVGKECYIGINNILDTSDNIVIGNFVHIAGPSTGLWCHSSAQMCINGIPLNDKDRDKYRPTSPIIIEDNVYIGGNCTIYPGVKICHHSIIAPNSAVTKNVEAYTMVGGVPAKFIKKIYIEK